MTVAELYRILCRLYGVERPMEIEHYLLMARDSETGLVIGNRVSGREALLIRQTGDDLEMGLFVNPSIVAALASGDALSHPDELACAAEGVSHFLYVADRAAKGLSVSRLELELQGEVDKFILIHLIASEDMKAAPPWLFERLFADHSFDPGLDAEELERYATASHFGAKYCARLRDTCFNPLRLAKLRPQARDFFERNLSGKISRLIP